MHKSRSIYEAEGGPDFQLTNEERACLGLPGTGAKWVWIRLKGPAHAETATWACFDDITLRKTIQIGPSLYREQTWQENATRDFAFLLPKRKGGDLKRLTVAALSERKPRGPYLSWDGETLVVGHYTSRRIFYHSGVDSVKIRTSTELIEWLKHWTEETTPADKAEADTFSREKCRHFPYHEGDFFRFKVGRRDYGYGRILLDYQMQSQRRRCWSALLGHPLVVKVYQILTDDPHVPPEQLRELRALPSQLLLDNRLYYGDYVITGSLPLRRSELDFPVLYGRSVDRADKGKDVIMLQCGRIYRRLEGAQLLPGCGEFLSTSVRFDLRVNRALLQDVIAAGNNDPVWRCLRNNLIFDLRDPVHQEQLDAVCNQFDLPHRKLLITNQ